MAHHHLTCSQKRTQGGITLIEALISLLILALGVLGLAVVQARMLVETRTTNSRATAIRLIADLGDRIRMNRGVAQLGGGGNALAINEANLNTLSPYDDTQSGQGFGTILHLTTHAVPDGICDPANPPVNNGTQTACTAQQQVQYDLWAWRTEVAQSLMNGVASITQVPDSNPQQLQVVVAWQANENTNITLAANTAQQALAQQVANPLQLAAATAGTNICSNSINTNTNVICHVDFISLAN